MADFSRLPGPNADLWDWQLLAACRGVDSSLFFHPEGERGAARSARENSAKEVCMRCPVRAQCAAHALAVREPYGVWGGLTEDEREELMGRARNRLVSASSGAGRHRFEHTEGTFLHTGRAHARALQFPRRPRQVGRAPTSAASAPAAARPSWSSVAATAGTWARSGRVSATISRRTAGSSVSVARASGPYGLDRQLGQDGDARGPAPTRPTTAG